MEIELIGIAFLAGLAAYLLRLPLLTGYIGAGFALAAGAVRLPDWVDVLSDVGIVLLLFTVGLHIRIQNIVRAEVWGVGGLHLMASALVFAPILLLLGLSADQALILAVGLGFSSTVLTAKALEDREELDAYHGRVAMGILVFQDLVAVGLIAVAGGSSPNIYALSAVGVIGVRPLVRRILDQMRSPDMQLLFGLAVAFSMAEWFLLIGLGDKLGALIGGILLAGHVHTDALYDRLWSLKEVFIIGFFLKIGLTGLPTLADALIGLGILTLVAAKGALFFWLLTRFGLRARTSFMAAISLTAYSEFALIVAADMPDLPDRWVITIALIVGVSFVINATLNRYADRLWGRYEAPFCRFESDGPHPDHLPMSIGNAHILIFGMGRVGTAAYDYLVQHGRRPIGLDTDPARIQEHLTHPRRVVFGEAQDPELWERLPLPNIRAIILTIPSLSSKITATQLARQHGYEGHISALVDDNDIPQAMLDAGATSLTLPFIQAGQDLAEMTLRLPDPNEM